MHSKNPSQNVSATAFCQHFLRKALKKLKMSKYQFDSQHRHTMLDKIFHNIFMFCNFFPSLQVKENYINILAE